MSFLAYTMKSGQRIFECAADGPPIACERDATDIIGAAFAAQPDWILIPVARLDEKFLDLKTRLAGAVLQKFVNYGFRVALVGDVSSAQAASAPLRDFIRETNAGTQIWFCPDREDFAARLLRL